MLPTQIPLADCATEALAKLSGLTGSKALRALDGTTLLCERAMLAGLKVPGRISAGRGCRLFDAVGGTIALNLSRPDDREMLAALFECDELDPDDMEGIACCVSRSDAMALTMRGREMGLAIAFDQEGSPWSSVLPVLIAPGRPATATLRPFPRVLDLSALWAGPLASHLLWLAGADVTKVESRNRPDAMRLADNSFYALLNQAKASVALDFDTPEGRHSLLSLIASSDIVIEAARPRALSQLGIDAAQILQTTPGLVWITITGHGAQGEPAGWVGFGDDCGVAGGLTAALHAVSGRSGFVGDAIADPLTGIFAALAAWEAWKSRQGGGFGLAMSQVVAGCLAQARARDLKAFNASLSAWSTAVGAPFSGYCRRTVGLAANFGADTQSCLERLAQC